VTPTSGGGPATTPNTVRAPRPGQVRRPALAAHPGPARPPARRALAPASSPERAPSPTRRAARAPSRRLADLFLALAGLGFGATLGLAVTAETRGALVAPGGVAMALGRLAGLTGAYLMLVMVVLIARMPFLERAVGQDRLLRWHRRIGPWPISLIAAHGALITLGYAQAARTGVLHQLWILIDSYPNILAAVAAFGLLVAAGVTSFRLARRRMRYESWWAVHLYTYLALALAFAHQIGTGASFVGHPLTRIVWSVAWACTAGLVLVFRIALPVWRSMRHRLRVVQVHEEGPGVVSVVCEGRHLERLAVSGGQFFQWRFLRRGMWWQAHPYSISAMPRPPYLRFTIKALGDQSRSLAAIESGTRVAIEGPYGTFTHHVRETNGVVLIGAGVGVTPLRALLEDLPESVDAVVILRGSKPADLVLRDEMSALVDERGGRLHEVVGQRGDVRFDARAIRHLVPDIASRDVYVCGPDGFTASVVAAAERLRVPAERLHTEAFSF